MLRKKKFRKTKNTKRMYKRTYKQTYEQMYKQMYKNRLILSSQKKNKCFEELFKSMKI